MDDLASRVYFATTSDIKRKQYESIFADLGVRLYPSSAIVHAHVEPQYDERLSEEHFVSHPLRLAARFVERTGHTPYLIEDTMLIVNAFSKDPSGPGGLPGADTKNWWRNLGSAGLLSLMKGNTDRSARFICQIGAYLGQGKYCFAQAEVKGSISNRVKTRPVARRDFPRSNPHFFHEVFVPSGSGRTFGEMAGTQFVEFDYRRVCARRILAEIRRATAPRHVQLELGFAQI